MGKPRAQQIKVLYPKGCNSFIVINFHMSTYELDM